MKEPPFLLFASDATLVGLISGALLIVAVIAALGERRRKKRRDIDAVGWMPWATLSVAATFAGFTLLAVAVMGWLRG